MTRSTAILLTACAVLLTACSSGGGTVLERLVPLMAQQVLGDAVTAEQAVAAAPIEITRAQIEEIPSALIALRVGEMPRALVAPIVDNSGYLVYQDPARRGIVMRGGLITATHGFGYNLDSVKHGLDDPVVVPTPVAEWPVEVSRSYAYTIRGQQRYDIAVVCHFERGVRELIEIVELRFEVVRVIETCVNPRRTFVNTHWVAPDSGFIWKSQQWVSPRLSPFTVEIVRPFGRA